jgi:uncharacterized protein involved in response to NO
LIRHGDHPASESSGWRLHRLLEAPHRLSFAAAAFILVVSGLWWAAVNLAPVEGMAVRWTLPPAAVHGAVMTFGFMPLFFTGFLFTAGPKWLAQPPVPAGSLLPHVLPMVCGWLVFLLSAHGRDASFGRLVGAIGLAAVAFGWFGVAWKFVKLIATSKAADRVHAMLVGAGAMFGAAALGLVSWALAAGDFDLLRAATLSSLWGFVGLVFAAVAHRMIPFFSAAAVPVLDAWRPLWLLWCFAVVFAFEAIASWAQAYGWLTAPAWLVARAGIELTAGACVLALAVRWGLVQSLCIRLLAMLHLGFTWLGVALLLFGVSHLMQASAPSRSLGLAPLHAYTMGFLGSTMLAMVTRVSCGHGGRTLTADDFVWRLFWVLQVAVVARVAAGVLATTSVAGGTALVVAAAMGWAGVFLAWGVRYGRWYGTPRLDGRAG